MKEHRLPTHFKLPEGRELQDLIACAKDWALFNGAAMRSKQKFSPDSIIFAPFTLLPSSFPKAEFEKAVEIQPVLNELMHNVAHDYEFLKNVLANTIQVDDFTRKLFEIYEIVYREGFAQSYSLGLLRSDYMVDDKNETLNIRQVEINTIASSLAGLGTQFTLLHRFILERLQHSDDLEKLPQNPAITGLCVGLLEAWKIYNNPESVILMVIEDVSYNICDQRFHEFEIYKLNPRIKVLRRTLTELANCGSLNCDKKFLIDGKEVAVVYYRSGYSPDQYHTNKEWKTRLMLERSKAIKCPSIQYHLAGTKKVQQVLASDYNLSKFLTDPVKVKNVREIFTELYSLDLDASGDKAVEMALKSPEKFVLKPQREGGGNNIYGENIPKILSDLGRKKERSAYILMNRIQPPVNSNYIIRPGQNREPVLEDVVSELGIFGVIIGTKDKILTNKQAGHMLRTKNYLSNEGGVSAGVGALDSPFLF